ncbi:hypothetical protein P43SY_008097 [Pythium insidiosum]|uniref:Uncharacterized protein n=1 Tax=Pythium insidiosum TaxID=114742 RepID=A0AAD5Q5B8_PYTIN|nr:hypothetical protein P43SY_008097 [Pythium insidiosum]
MSMPKHAHESREQQLARVQRRLPVSSRDAGKRKPTADKSKAKKAAAAVTKRKAIKLELHALHDTVDDIQRQVDAASRGIQELRALIDAHLAGSRAAPPPQVAPLHTGLSSGPSVAHANHIDSAREHWDELVGYMPDDPLLLEALAPCAEDPRFAC